ncbi:MAG: OsmC family protein [Gemmatimonadetes bacterium]|nr:OsmC family protein [Gemmatimonadota bacterium]
MSAPHVNLTWKDDFEFSASRGQFVTAIDGNERAGPSPVSMLIESVAACAAIDVVHVLRKGRQELEGLQISVWSDRVESSPRRLTGLRFEFRVAGPVAEKKARRAIDLSFEKLCSVYHSLRPDIDLSWDLVMQTGGQAT